MAYLKNKDICFGKENNKQSYNNEIKRRRIAAVIVECKKCDCFKEEYDDYICIDCFENSKRNRKDEIVKRYESNYFVEEENHHKVEECHVLREGSKPIKPTKLSSWNDDAEFDWKIFDDDQYQHDNDMHETDRLMAELLQEEEEDQNKIMKSVEVDKSMAFILQEEEEEHQKKMRECRLEEQLSVLRDPESIAFKFVSLIVSLNKSSSNLKALGGSSVAIDDLHPMTVALIQKQQSFLNKKLNTVEIAYHYTTLASLTTIRTHGLMSQSQRAQHNIVSKFNGASYGDGVYVALDEKSSSGFGEILLVCGILRGTVGTDTTVCNGGNMWLVLKQSCQVVPLLQIPKDKVLLPQSAAMLTDLRKELTDIFNETLNRKDVEGEKKKKKKNSGDV